MQRSPGLNARLGAITLATAALLTAGLGHADAGVASARAMALAASLVAAWFVIGELGASTRLNRGGMFCFVLAVGARLALAIDGGDTAGQLALLSAAALAAAVTLWSTALLARRGDRPARVVGLLGASLPMLLVLSVLILPGAVASLGFVTPGVGAPPGAAILALSERFFLGWTLLTAWLLWRGVVWPVH